MLIKKPKTIKNMGSNFQKNLAPGENICIDASICGFRGRILNRVFSLENPEIFGIKSYVLCDSKTSYLLDFQFAGEKCNLSEMVVNLFHRYGNEYRILHMDNFYNSKALEIKLLENKIYCNGTIRKTEA